MTIDERLEALAQTVELLAGMQLKTEERLQTFTQHADERLEALTQRVGALAATMELTAQMQLKTEDNLRRFEEFTRLVLSNHEDRMRRLEAGE